MLQFGLHRLGAGAHFADAAAATLRDTPEAAFDVIDCSSGRAGGSCHGGKRRPPSSGCTSPRSRTRGTA